MQQQVNQREWNVGARGFDSVTFSVSQFMLEWHQTRCNKFVHGSRMWSELQE